MIGKSLTVWGGGAGLFWLLSKEFLSY